MGMGTVTLALAGMLGPMTLAQAATPKASSEAVSQEHGARKAALAFDGLLSTSWAEGATGNGEGEWLELPLDRPIDVTSVSIWPGDLSGRDWTIRETPRPHLATLTIDVGGDQPVEQEIRLDDPAVAGPLRVDIPILT